MTDQNKNKIEEVIAEKLKSLTEEQKEFARTSILAEGIFEVVIDQLHVQKDDLIYQNSIIGILKRQTTDHIILAIWSFLTDEQAKHLQDFINQSASIYPDKSENEVLMEFALLYPELMENIYKSLSKFFADFIKRFNEISDA